MGEPSAWMKQGPGRAGQLAESEIASADRAEVAVAETAVEEAGKT